MAYPGAKIILLTESGFREVRYEDTEHYSITKEFLNNPARMLEELFSDG
jgi:predicted ATPase